MADNHTHALLFTPIKGERKVFSSAYGANTLVTSIMVENLCSLNTITKNDKNPSVDKLGEENGPNESVSSNQSINEPKSKTQPLDEQIANFYDRLMKEIAKFYFNYESSEQRRYEIISVFTYYKDWRA